jgi:hypothetical protein
MHLTDLLDKNDRIQLEIVNDLMNSTEATAARDLNKRMAISSFVFNTNVDQLIKTTDSLEMGISVQVFSQNGVKYIQLAKEPELDIKKLYYHYFDKSINYQILMATYFGEGNSFMQMSQQYHISEAVFYRHIREVNQYLKQFEIKIKNNRLLGDELNICYFLYHFFLQSMPLQEINKQFNDESVNLMIAFLEVKLQQRFSIMNRYKFNLWASIIKRRSIYTAPRSQTATNLLKLFNEDSLYKLVRQAYYQMISHTATTGSEFKALYLYMFLTSMFILEPTVIVGTADDDWPTQLPQVKELDNLIYNSIYDYFNINEAAIEPHKIQEWRYILTQAHTQLLLFGNFISATTARQMHPRRQTTETISDVTLSLAGTLVHRLENHLGEPLMEETERNMHWLYANLIKQIETYSTDIIKIGTYSYVDFMRAMVLSARMSEVFNSQYHIQCEVARTSTTYDLFITDSDFGLEDYHFEQMYLLSDTETVLDMNDIHRLMDQIYRKKKNL